MFRHSGVHQAGKADRSPRTLRILAVSDLRVQPLCELEAIVKRVKPDLLLYAGDDVERFSARQDSWSAVARRLPLGLAGVIGNDCDRRARAAFRQASCHDLHAKPLVLDDLVIGGLEGAPASRDFGIGPTLYSEADARRHLKRLFMCGGDRPVLLVSHAPPYSVLDFAVRFGPQNIGSRAVLRVLSHPRLVGVVCGHVHMQGGRQERRGGALVVNCASHDTRGAPLKYAVLNWDGCRLSATTEVHNPRGQLSAIHRMYWRHVEALAKKGVTTLRDIQRLGPEGLAAIVGVSAGRYWLAAKAHIEGRPVMRERPVHIADSALFVDVETSLRPEDVWMVSFAWATGEIHQLCDLEPQARGRLLRELDRQIRRLAPAQLVQWSGYDRSALEAAYRSTDQRPPKWLDRSRWVDAMQWMNRAFALPLSSLSVKSVSSHFGYQYSEDQLDGLTVGWWYQSYLSSGQAFPVARVKTYNRDDVEAVRHVVKTIQCVAALEPEPECDLQGRSAVRRHGRRVRTLPERRALVSQAVANFRKAIMVRVEAGSLKRSAARAAVAKFRAHMSRTHLPEARPSKRR